MFGEGLLKGMSITLKRFLGPNLAEAYPEVKPNLPPRTRSSMVLEPSKCIACGLCVNVCPNQVINLTSEKDENNKKVLKTYEMNIGRCLLCGLCTEVCPTKALVLSQEFENAVYHREALLWDMIERSKHSNLPSGKVG
ncbi:NADH-quinone oxidoreductase subunit I [Desulfosporosinus fructosivorans]|uniref:NADH-quinone oxidoreductase subunit I n=1 Tax=Desulfosporosinus fructosivorans TaxID=2018669 RepID=A0A4Z0QXY5_9FIRM|nr:NADH-quinone oxidoreductase subunit I [Desulfosporosinus fructosivorans]TGE35159.1 NADH-quinone oxidoreductase subunit I [Desulfosporosinus fructosivorans]